MQTDIEVNDFQIWLDQKMFYYSGRKHQVEISPEKILNIFFGFTQFKPYVKYAMKIDFNDSHL